MLIIIPRLFIIILIDYNNFHREYMHYIEYILQFNLASGRYYFIIIPVASVYKSDRGISLVDKKFMYLYRSAETSRGLPNGTKTNVWHNSTLRH